MATFQNISIITGVPLPEEQLLAPGIYRSMLEEVEEKYGNSNIDVMLKVLDDDRGRYLIKTFSLDPDLIEAQEIKKFVHSLGLDAEKEESYSTENWLGRTVLVYASVAVECGSVINVPCGFERVPEAQLEGAVAK